jgi:multidrug efflux system membrane fusion protein
MNARFGFMGRPARHRGPATSSFVPLCATAMLLATSLLVVSCARGSGERSARRGEVAPVLAAQATREDVPITLRTIGTVEAYRSVAVRAQVGGTLTQVHFREGQDVKKGDLLFSIDSRPYQVALEKAESNLAEEKSKAAIAALDARRSASLFAQQLVSGQDHERALAEAQAESAAVQSLVAASESARLDLEYCSIRSPISGRTSNLFVQEGNLVRANDTQALLVINQISPIFVTFSAPQKQLLDIQRYMAGGELVVEALPSGATGPPERGRLTFVNNAVDPATGTVLLKAEFANEDKRLWPGEFVQVKVILTTRTGALVVPAAAVQSGQRGDYVLVIKADETAEMRPVTTGPRLDGQAIIESGLEAGETVVTDGHLRVVPGAKVSVKRDLEAAGAPAR